jgi:hypothetical protein
VKLHLIKCDRCGVQCSLDTPTLAVIGQCQIKVHQIGASAAVDRMLDLCMSCYDEVLADVRLIMEKPERETASSIPG